MVFGGYRRQQGLFRLDLRSGAVAPLFTGAEVPKQLYYQASFAPDGGTLYFPRQLDSGQNRWQIVARELSSGLEAEITTVEALDLRTAVSPDGRMLALAQHDPASRQFRLLVAPVSGGEVREVYRTPNAFFVSTVLTWTPHGRYLLFRGVEVDSQNTLTIAIPIGGGEARRIEGIEGTWGFHLHPDGRRFIVWDGTSLGEFWVIENLPGTGSGGGS